MPGDHQPLNMPELEDALNDLALPQEVSGRILAYCRKRSDIMDLAAKAYDETVKNKAGEFDIMRRKPFTRLAVICALLPELRRRFVQAGMSRQVWLDSIDDIRLRQSLFFKKTGTIGLSMGDVRWMRHLMGFKLFKLGSLQFQPFEMLYLDEEGIGEDFMRFSPEQKRKLPPGSPVLNTHIQHGANLEPAALAATFQKAREFFLRYFSQQQFLAFITYSWLLYPGNRLLLPPNSRILHFAGMWEVVSSNHDKTQALERIFGGRKRKHSDYPQHTSLQRAALKNLGALGYACGIIPF